MSSAMSLTRDQLDGGQQFILFAYRPFLIPFKSTPVLHQTTLPNAEMIRRRRWCADSLGPAVTIAANYRLVTNHDLTVVIWGCKLKIVGSGRSSSA